MPTESIATPPPIPAAPAPDKQVGPAGSFLLGTVTGLACMVALLPATLLLAAATGASLIGAGAVGAAALGEGVGATIVAVAGAAIGGTAMAYGMYRAASALSRYAYKNYSLTKPFAVAGGIFGICLPFLTPSPHVTVDGVNMKEEMKTLLEQLKDMQSKECGQESPKIKTGKSFLSSNALGRVFEVAVDDVLPIAAAPPPAVKQQALTL